MTKPSGLLFLTHVGDPGGAEFKMLDLCKTVRHCAEVVIFQHGSLEKLLRDRGIAYCVCPMSRAASGVRRESGLLGMRERPARAPGLIGRAGRAQPASRPTDSRSRNNRNNSARSRSPTSSNSIPARTRPSSSFIA